MTFNPPLTYDAWLLYARTKAPLCTPEELRAYLEKREVAGTGKRNV